MRPEKVSIGTRRDQEMLSEHVTGGITTYVCMDVLPLFAKLGG